MSYLELDLADFAPLWPTIVLAAGGLVTLLLEVGPPRLRRAAGPVSLLVLALSAALLAAAGVTDVGAGTNPLTMEVASDALTLGFAPAIYLAALAALALGGPYLRRKGCQRAEYQALVLFSTAGMVLLTQARDLLMVFLALETLSIPLYVLAGFFPGEEQSLESSLKYFTVGAFSSAFVAFGMALTYGAGGTISLSELSAALAGAAQEGGGRLFLAHGGLAFLLVGFGFKIAMVPFHSWAGDVYQGAPTPVTAFLGVGSKAAGFAGLLRLLVVVFPGLPSWAGLVAVLAGLTLIIGNCVATLQEDVKRLLAYSGIAHVGFLLTGLVAHQRSAGGSPVTGHVSDLGQSPALVAVVFYVLAYALMTLGAMTVVVLLEGDYNDRTRLIDYAGLASRQPLLSFALLVFLLSLGGMPPLAGFVGKWLILREAVAAGLVPLAVVGALSSVVAFYYYLRIVVQAYLRPVREGEEAPAGVSASAAWLIGAAVTGTVLLGLLPSLLLGWLQAAGPAVSAALGS